VRKSDTSRHNEYEQNDNPVDPSFHLEFSRIDSVEDLSGRNIMLPGYVLVTAALVSPIARMVDVLTDKDAWGELARSLEMALVSFDERDFRMLFVALRDLVNASVSASEQELLAQHGIICRLRQLVDVFAAAEKAKGEESTKQRGEQ